MFDALSSKLEAFIKNIKGQGHFTPKNIEEIAQKLKMTLLEAAVHFKVAKAFVDDVTQKSLGQKVHESLTPAQHYLKIVHEELVEFLGSKTQEINFHVKPPLIILMVGLQGSGKTTTSSKLAHYLVHEKKRSPYLVPADVYRPAAIEQLKILSSQLKISCFNSSVSMLPLEICRVSFLEAQRMGLDTVIIDTAGRLQMDHELMNELLKIKQEIHPHEILLVADSMTGQEAVRIAQGFHEKLNLTGIILTKADGDAKGGAALSMKQMTGCPIRFLGVGEKLQDLELFYPDRMASRILQMGDMLTLIEKTQKMVDVESATKLQKKIQKNDFTLDDFKAQMGQIQKLGSLQDVLGMIPGGNKLLKAVPAQIDPQKEAKKVMAIIDSMTPRERNDIEILNGSRKLRIAKGSGTEVSEINRFLKQFMEAKKMMKRMSKFGMKHPFGLF